MAKKRGRQLHRHNKNASKSAWPPARFCSHQEYTLASVDVTKHVLLRPLLPKFVEALTMEETGRQLQRHDKNASTSAWPPARICSPHKQSLASVDVTEDVLLRSLLPKLG
ncbi:hypothetical protein CCACVL1_28013 [Corchorus capsularis]|uniref:Uncharacterized protein n=1 Tax=Corchorus capsularis TaxID=210143 RepID=A0A1R3G7T2_COCAP|nr:hypothetical protein CCACVL1_28013 [Corchorus capsularis]